MSLDVIGDVSLNHQIMYPMSCDCSVVRVVYGTVPNVGSLHGPTQVEMDGIATQAECLTTIANFSVLNPGEMGIQTDCSWYELHILITGSIYLSMHKGSKF